MVRRLDVLDLGILPVASVIDDVDPLADLLPEDRQIDFACEFAEYTGFWEGLEEAWPEGSSRRILDWLISAQNNDGEKRKRARALLRKFLKDTLSADRWHTEIVEDGDILKLAARLPNLERQPLALGAALYQALHDMLGELIDDADRFHGRRWFEAAAMLSADGRKTLLRNLRDRLNSKVDVPNLLELFKSGGNMLLAEGDFAERGDDTVRHILLPILAIDEGVMWAVENSPQIESWIRSSGASTQSFLGEQIRDRLDSATETTRPLLVNLQEDWKLGRG
jgi:hypothetical protein